MGTFFLSDTDSHLPDNCQFINVLLLQKNYGHNKFIFNIKNKGQKHVCRNNSDRVLNVLQASTYFDYLCMHRN